MGYMHTIQMSPLSYDKNQPNEERKDSKEEGETGVDNNSTNPLPTCAGSAKTTAPKGRMTDIK